MKYKLCYNKYYNYNIFSWFIMEEYTDSSSLFPQGHIERAEAGSFTDTEGHQVPKGKLCTRVVFQGCEDTRLAPAAREVFDDSSYLKGIHETTVDLMGYTKLFIRDDTSKEGELIEVMVNINDLAQRLGIARSDIVQAANKGQLENLVKSRILERMRDQQSMPVILDQLQSDYASVAERYQEAMEAQNLNPDLSQEELNYIVREGLAGILSNTPGFSSDKPFQTGAAEVELNDGRQFIVGRKSNGDLSILEVPKREDFLGAGNFGSVEGVNSTLETQRGVVKLPADRPIFNDEGISPEDHLEQATYLLKLEAEILSDLWDGCEEDIEGIQHAPFATISVRTPAGEEIKTVIYTRRYEGATLASWGRGPQADLQPKRTLLNMCRQGFKGLAHASSRKVVNGDVKSDNICIDIDPKTGEPSLRMIDWGGAVNLSKVHPSIFSDPLMTACTFASIQDYMALENLGKQYWYTSWYSTGAAETYLEAHNEVQYSRDVVALAGTLAYLLTGENTIVQDYGALSGPSTRYNVIHTQRATARALRNKGYPQEVIQLFNNMLRQNPLDRLSADEAVAYFDVILSSDADWLDQPRNPDAIGKHEGA